MTNLLLNWKLFIPEKYSVSFLTLFKYAFLRNWTRKTDVKLLIIALNYRNAKIKNILGKKLINNSSLSLKNNTYIFLPLSNI